MQKWVETCEGIVTLPHCSILREGILLIQRKGQALHQVLRAEAAGGRVSRMVFLL